MLDNKTLMAFRIFINYRHLDDPGYVESLHMFLRSSGDFKSNEIFRDVAGDLRPGDHFPSIISEKISKSAVMLCVIGPRWLDLLLTRRKDPLDFVRLEIEEAFHKNVIVIPVLVGGASMPPKNKLPDKINKLSDFHACELRINRFEDDCEILASDLIKIRSRVPIDPLEDTPPTILAISYFDNITYHILVQGGLLSQHPNISKLWIIRPERINDFQYDLSRVGVFKFQKEVFNVPSAPYGYIPVYVSGDKIIHFPTPLYALDSAPMYRRFRDQLRNQHASSQHIDSKLAAYEEENIRIFFEILENLICDGKYIRQKTWQIVNIAEAEVLR